MIMLGKRKNNTERTDADVLGHVTQAAPEAQGEVQTRRPITRRGGGIPGQGDGEGDIQGESGDDPAGVTVRVTQPG